MKLILENNDGKAVRSFFVNAEEAFVITRHDTKRVEVHASLERLENEKIKFETLGSIKKSETDKVLLIGRHGRLKYVNEVSEVIRDDRYQKESSRSWYGSLGIMVIGGIIFATFLQTRSVETVAVEQELKQQMVKIVKHMPPRPKPAASARAVERAASEPQPQAANRKTASIKRMGALSVLGSMKSGQQRGGLNLGAANTTAGPGLGGTQGSGGVQTTLYGKGLVAAPLGAGSNMEGGGGYGTKGKGGGQAGYGQLSLIGSAGTASVPLGREAIIEGGLDRDLIDGVIRRNMGQIRFCYEQGLQADPALGGRVAIGFTIGANGQVKAAGIESTSVGSKVVEDCILLRLRSWKFPLPEGGVDVKVSYPFVLRRAGQG